MIGWSLEQLGLLPGFSAAMQENGNTFLAGLTMVAASALWDLIDMVTRPDLSLPTCHDPQSSLPLE